MPDHPSDQQQSDQQQPDQRRAEFIKASIWHGSLDQANAILAAHPELARPSEAGENNNNIDIHIAAILGDDAAVRRALARDPSLVSAKSEPYGGDPLVCLCLSKYLRQDPSRSDAFLRAAAALLDAGADPNAGFWHNGEFETALYGAAGVAHHVEMTRLLLSRGADPTDGEAVYHSPETDDYAAMALLVETGKLRPDDLTLMLIRKHDWHDHDGAKYLLEHGADPNNRRSGRGWRPLNHALARSNGLPTIALLLDHGADPTLTEDQDGLTGIARAAREGRRDVLDLFEQRGIPIASHLHGVDRLIAACARDDAATVRTIAREQPALVQELIAMGSDLLAKFANNDNAAGVRQLLDLGIDVATPYAAGDGYFGEPKGSLPIHIAAWRGNPEVVTLLIARGSPIDVPDANGRTPLALAIKVCFDVYWSWRRTPDTVAALLRAGASVRGITFPTGYAEVDDLLRAHGATATSASTSTSTTNQAPS